MKVNAEVASKVIESEGRARIRRAKAAWGSRNLTDTAISPQRGGSDSTVARTCQATGEALLAPGRNHRSRVDRITGSTGKSIDGERVAEEVSDLREDWMKYADEVLADEAIVAIVYEGLAKRHPKSRCRGRRGAPADVVLRLLTLKHIRNWSYEELEREVRANLVYRDFTRVGAGKMPDAKTIGRWGVALGPQVIAQIHERMVAIAKEKGVVKGRKMRVDTTVVETNIHY